MREQNEAISGSDAFLAGLERIGVTLETHVNAAVTENNQLLAEAKILYQDRELNLTQLERMPYPDVPAELADLLLRIGRQVPVRGAHG